MSQKSYEQRMFEQDSKEKKRVASNARHTRTHCGKGGSVKFPSDYMTAKERRAMNGKCETYRMNAPISWEEFKTWPDEHKITYIKLLRQKYNAPDTAIAEMMGVSSYTISMCANKLGLSIGKNGRKRTWDKEGFDIWPGKTESKPACPEVYTDGTEKIADAIETDARLTRDDIEKLMVKDDTPELDTCNDCGETA